MTAKSAGILGVCLIVAASIFAASSSAQPRVAAPAQIGRFQFGSVQGHAYVLDTATGRIWEKFATDSSGSTSEDFNDAKL